MEIPSIVLPTKIIADDKIFYRAGYKYQLRKPFQINIGITGYDINDWFIRLTTDGFLTLKEGYASDGPSGPSIDTKNFMRGSFVHDALYQLISKGLLPHEYKEFADRWLQKLCIEDGMWRIRAWYVYQAVHFCGSAALCSDDKEIVGAP